MKTVEKYGPPIIGYEGACSVTVDEGQNRVESKGYFEALQFSSGRIVTRVIPTDRPRGLKFGGRPDSNCELSFTGADTGGWNLKTKGQTFFSRIGWLFAPMAMHPSELSFGAQYLETFQRRASPWGYSKVRFLVSNLLWDDNSGEEPEPIRLRVRNFGIVVKPVGDYADVAERLTHGHGAEPTAWIYIESRWKTWQQFESLGDLTHIFRHATKERAESRQLISMRGFRDLMDDLMHVFRLLTGNQVDWYMAKHSMMLPERRLNGSISTP